MKQSVQHYELITYLISYMNQSYIFLCMIILISFLIRMGVLQINYLQHICNRYLQRHKLLNDNLI